MDNKQQFIDKINEGYSFKGDSIILGGAMLDGECQHETFVKIPLKTMNRHGLIAGATGTGKTKTLQILAEQLSRKSVPVLLMDIKGDLSGVAAESPGHPKIYERHDAMGLHFEAGASSVEFLSLSEEPGLRLRATVSEFGPVLFSKILGLNDTQSGIVAVVFKYCDDNDIPLLDLKDFKKTLNYLLNEGKKEIEADYGRLSSASAGAIIRRMIEIETQGADKFFGERSFDVDDLTRIDENGYGMISILRLTDLQDRPKLFSTFMLQLLAEIYANFDEQGDDDRPRLVLFIDEAHLVFNEASDALLDQIETIVKLIRSKGVGIYFCTQNPVDIPNEVLSQLGLKIQHALRAFTAKDRKAIKQASENYPETEFYTIDELITQLGIGEAFVTVLNEKGIPTPLVHCLLRAPISRMDILTDNEIKAILRKSKLIDHYNKEVDRKSAYEILTEKIEYAKKEETRQEREEQEKKERKTSRRREKSTLEKIMNSSAARQVGRTMARELTRGLLGALGVSSTKRRRKRR
ncbi:MAG: helicase HerA-like domain-containing protein [Bacteroidota bacterium]